MKPLMIVTKHSSLIKMSMAHTDLTGALTGRKQTVERKNNKEILQRNILKMMMMIGSDITQDYLAI